MVPLLVGCAWVSDQEHREFVDADQDGAYADHFSDGDDCDDHDAGVHPAATEICNGIDDDCDSQIDEDAASWFVDWDGDGFGSANDEPSCEPLSGWVEDGTDCDDGDATRHPGAQELCDGLDNDCDGQADEEEPAWYLDADGDGHGAGEPYRACEPPVGYAASSGDCDDDDASTYPGAAEICDDTDNDCDGQTDEDAVEATWYEDVDEDGYGDPSVSAESCDPIDGYVLNADDCDPGDPAVHPRAEEVCNEIDDDCDTDIDEGVTYSFYADLDGDGHGDPDSSVEACSLPSGYANTATDCDDVDWRSNPDASETCDGADNDCDGDTDEPDAVDASIWYADSDGDAHGDAASTATACNQPSGYVSDDTDCDDTDAAVNPGEAEVCNDGADNDCDGTDNGCAWSGSYVPSDADVSFSRATSGDYAGETVAWAGDIDGDGHEDVVIGAEKASGSYSASGAAYIVYGPLSGSHALASADLVLYGDRANARFGHGVAGPGDLDGDGVDDLVVGANQSSATATSAGVVYVLSGPGTGTTTVSSSTADATISSPGQRSWFGRTVAGAGDVDGDGSADLLATAYGYNNGVGRVYLFHGPVTSQAATSADGIVAGTASGDGVGVSADGAGDLNGDGLDDLVLGAHNVGSGSAGMVALVVLGPATGTTSASSADGTYTGSGGSYSGGDVAGIGDMDGDGLDDLLVGDCGGDAAFVIKGPATSSSTLSASHAKLVGEGGIAGSAVSSGGDFDGDGNPDFIVGDGFYGSGSAYIVYGPVSGTNNLAAADVRIYGASGYFGIDVAGGADADADGFDDVLVGARSASDAVSLFLGSGL